MNRLRGFFDSMTGRIFLVLLVGFTLATGLALLAADAVLDMDTRHARKERAAERVADVVTLFELATPAQREALQRMGATMLWLALPDAPGVPDAEMHALVSKRIDAGQAAGLVVSRLDPGQCSPPKTPAAGEAASMAPLSMCWLVELPLLDGAPLKGVFAAPPAISVASRLRDPWFLSVLALAAAVLAFVVARIAASPLHAMAGAAAALGDDIDRPPLPESGPREVRLAAHALNHMQQRLRATLKERTRMLASIAHDLQTPLTRMRLRLEKIADPELKRRLAGDQEAMQTLIREGLDFVRSADSAEAVSLLDLRSLLESLVEDAVDAGHAATLGELCAVDVRVRPHTLRRCLLNLMDNAIFYGGSVEVSCATTGNEVTVRVRDRGPGISEEDLERVFEPFYRVEGSRSRDTGGTGLGLTIARTLAGRAGARLSLANHADGGLEAQLVLPGVGRRGT